MSTGFDKTEMVSGHVKMGIILNSISGQVARLIMRRFRD